MAFNIKDRQFEPSEANQLWTGGITSIPTGEGSCPDVLGCVPSPCETTFKDPAIPNRRTGHGKPFRRVASSALTRHGILISWSRAVRASSRDAGPLCIVLGEVAKKTVKPAATQREVDGAGMNLLEQAGLVAPVSEAEVVGGEVRHLHQGRLLGGGIPTG